MKKIIYLISLLLFTASFSYGQQFTLKGQIVDETTKEPLTGAYVHFDDIKGGAITDAFGYYAINGINPGQYKLKVKYIGYTEYEKKYKSPAIKC